MACGQVETQGWKTWYGPLFINLLIRFVSGVTMLERSQKRKPGFRIYMEETNSFFPWFYKVITGAEREAKLKHYEEVCAEEARKEQLEKDRKAATAKDNDYKA